jgi:predicted 3-demethylubiquinone-9 3-methyltransferase (glyoxalase superfamily)
VSRFGDGAPLPKGTLLAATFTLDGQEFMALNGGEPFAFSIGMSIVVRCDTQAEIDRLWDALSEGGAQVQCGWLTDRFGLSWQIVPTILSELVKDPVRGNRVMRALMTMARLDIAALKAAAEGR